PTITELHRNAVALAPIFPAPTHRCNRKRTTRRTPGVPRHRAAEVRGPLPLFFGGSVCVEGGRKRIPGRSNRVVPQEHRQRVLRLCTKTLLRVAWGSGVRCCHHG